MRHLAIDFGLARIGLAISDETGLLASPYGALPRRGTVRDVAEIMSVARGLGAAGIVLGLPRSASGERGELEDEVRAFGATLQTALKNAGLDIIIEWQDERFSTAEALRGMRAAGISQKQGRQATGPDSVDARAAAVILQGFLEARRMTPAVEHFEDEDIESQSF